MKKTILGSRNNVEAAAIKTHMRFRVNSLMFSCLLLVPKQIYLKVLQVLPVHIYYKHTVECSANILSVNRDVNLAKRGREKSTLF